MKTTRPTCDFVENHYPPHPSLGGRPDAWLCSSRGDGSRAFVEVRPLVSAAGEPPVSGAQMPPVMGWMTRIFTSEGLFVALARCRPGTALWSACDERLSAKQLQNRS